MKHAFTLIELVMVIAILAILSSIAVSKVSGVKEAAARKASVACQKSVERGVEAFLASGGRLNRLDSLINADTAGVATGSGDGFGTTIYNSFSVGTSGDVYLGPSDPSPTTEQVSEANAGIHPSLVAVLCRYSLSQTEVDALINRLGLRYLEFHNLYANPAGENSGTPYAHYDKGDDGTVPQALDGMDPNMSACIARGVTNGLYVAALNPASDLGRTIYQACGAELLNTKAWGRETYTESEAIAEAKAAGGALIAFGLGDSASIIGKANAGLDSAPYTAFTLKRYYSRYILLFRLKTAGSGSVATVIPEFAGVLDAEGNTVRAAQHIIKSL